MHSKLMRHALPVLLLSMAAICAKPSVAQKADLVIRNANVLRCDESMSRSSAVAVKEDRIVAVGTDQEIQSWIDQAHTTVVDADSQTLTPGLTDSHLHFVGLGQSLQMLDLSTAQTWQEIVRQVKEAAKSLPKGSWIEGRGWHQSKWTTLPNDHVDGYPDHKTMSDAVPDHPVVLTHASGHALFANAAAMSLAGVGPNTSDPEGGEIIKDSRGRPIGVFRENAAGLIYRAWSRNTARMSDQEQRDQLLGHIRLAGEACLKHGITSVHDAGTGFGEAISLRDIADSGDLPVRMTVMIRAPSYVLADRLPDSRLIGAGNSFLTVRSVKVSIDGALGPHGAWLLEPYADLPTSRGLNTVALDELERIARLCKQHKWQLCVHAIGDRANREVLDVFEEVLADSISSDHRWRIEHAQHLSPADIPRFASLGVIPAMQANHCTSDATFVPTRLGERRAAQGAYVWRSLIDAGAYVPNGTDAPVERVDPRVSLFAAVTRKLANGESFHPEQCMTRTEALLSYTLWPVRAAFHEKDLGSIEVGKLADLVLWDTDLLQCPPESLLSAEVKRVWVGGKEKSIDGG